MEAIEGVGSAFSATLIQAYRWNRQGLGKDELSPSLLAAAIGLSAVTFAFSAEEASVTASMLSEIKLDTIVFCF